MSSELYSYARCLNVSQYLNVSYIRLDYHPDREAAIERMWCVKFKTGFVSPAHNNTSAHMKALWKHNAWLMITS